MVSVDKTSFFWQYLSEGQKGLIEEGLFLLDHSTTDTTNHHIRDYSYLVFPFAKAYEGFLKQLFLDMGFITLHDYHSEHFRIGMALNPYLEKRLRFRSVYDKLVLHCSGYASADAMWDIWKRGRNLVFHYFPHNVRALSLDEARSLIQEILLVMEHALQACKIPNRQLSRNTAAAPHHAFLSFEDDHQKTPNEAIMR